MIRIKPLQQKLTNTSLINAIKAYGWKIHSYSLLQIVYGSINTRIINLMSSFKVLSDRDTWKSVTCKCPRCPIWVFHAQKCAIETTYFHFLLVVLKWTLLEIAHPSSEFFQIGWIPKCSWRSRFIYTTIMPLFANT